MSLVMEGPVTRAHAGMKARNRPRDDGPLFGGTDNHGGADRYTESSQTRGNREIGPNRTEMVKP
jgi:hypothetical protein